MTKLKLIELLDETALFQNYEILEIVKHCGQYTIGNAIIACEVIGIELTGNDIDIMILDRTNDSK